MVTPGNRLIDYDGTFFSGVKSDSDPSQVPIGYSWMAVNMINLGGLWSCRPGNRCIVGLPDGNLQGAALFRPQTGLEQIVVAIDGAIYVAEWPFKSFRLLTNVQMSPSARQVFWCQTVQSATRLTKDFSSAIKVIIPRTVLFIQDGGDTAPAWYDGANSGHIRDNLFETPSGGSMVWIGDRLWVANGNKVLASDISNPFSFREQEYLGGVTGFFFDGDVTGMISTPSSESPQLMVFTDVAGSILQASIRDRGSWPTTPNFQIEVVKVGLSSSRSLTSHYGRLTWYSSSGLVIYDPATSGKLTTRLPIRDNEMLVSKATLDDDLSRVACGSFGQYLLISVPAEDTFNRHTWVLNQASLATLTDESGPSWSGYWLGTRPVEWVSGKVAGADHIYHVSTDEDGKNRLWESFISDRLDNGCPITWGVFSRGYFGQTAAIQQKPPGSQCRLAWADIALVGIEENLDIGVFYAGGVKGAFRQMLAKEISVSKGSLDSTQEITAASTIYAFKPQSRTIRTEDANQQEVTSEVTSCGTESEDLDSIDQSFQLLVVGHGPATIRWIRPFAFTVSEDLSGDPDACLDETGFHGVRFDGVGISAETLAEVIEDLAVRGLRNFTSVKTEVITQDGITAVGVGVSDSLVSQKAADRVATIIATKMAESEITRDIPPILSVAEGFEANS